MAKTNKTAAPAKKCCAAKCCKKAAAPKVEKLAIDGGKKVWAKPFPAWPQFNPKTGNRKIQTL